MDNINHRPLNSFPFHIFVSIFEDIYICKQTQYVNISIQLFACIYVREQKEKQGIQYDDVTQPN